MVHLTKFALFLLWLVVFVITCVVMGFFFPFLKLAEKAESVFSNSAVQ